MAAIAPYTEGSVIPIPPRVIFFMGAEREGLSADLQKEAELSIVVPGSGAVESLNVASASAVLLAEFQRQKRTHAKLDLLPVENVGEGCNHEFWGGESGKFWFGY